MYIHKETKEMYIGSAISLYSRLKAPQASYSKYERGN